MIIDAHAHAFPYVANKGIFDSEADHLRFLQRHMTTHPQGGRRFRDNELSKTPTLWDGKTPGFEGLLDVNFHVGPYGRFEWTKDGEDYYIQFFPVSLEVMESKPERMLAQMQYVGVEKAMLQFAKMYAITNEYHSDCVRRWPHKFRACTAVDEDAADDKGQIDSLRHAVRDLGLTALYFECNGFGKSNYQNHLDDAKYGQFWEEVQSLGIPVLWDIRIAPRRTSHTAYMEEAMRLRNLISRFPRLRHVITHGFPSSAFSSPGVIPETCGRCFAIQWSQPSSFFPFSMEAAGNIHLSRRNRSSARPSSEPGRPSSCGVPTCRISSEAAPMRRRSTTFASTAPSSLPATWS